jgi:hypothetical protein
MGLLAKVVRGVAEWHFRARGLSTIPNIPTAEFKNLIEALEQEGWRRTYEYQGFDAWIDYGGIRLRRDGIRLKFRWDNWQEGSVEGPASSVAAIATRIRRGAAA